jgi:hypothetical protein
MSLLREAERCVANQYTHNFNAFITPLARAGQWLDRVKEADERKEQGSNARHTIHFKANGNQETPNLPSMAV